MNKILCLGFLAGISLNGFAQKVADEVTLAKQQKVLIMINDVLQQKHYKPQVINDEFSNSIWQAYIKRLDPRKEILLQADIDRLKKYQNSIDDEITGKTPIAFLPAVLAIYNQRFDETSKQYSKALSAPFNLNKKGKGMPANGNEKFSATETAKENVSRRHIKYMVLQTLIGLQQDRSKSKPGSAIHKRTDAELEKQARETIAKRIEFQQKRIKSKLDEDKQFIVFANTIVKKMDPHSDYFPPVESRSFQESISNRFYGIGAQLQEKEGGIAIMDMEPGGPALKSGQVQVGDLIVGVGEGAEGVITDITALAINEVTPLIRGSRGTTVKLLFKKADGGFKTIALVREEIVQADGLIKTAILSSGANKTGYMMLPKFYEDATNPDGPHCARDVAAALDAFKKEDVNGIIMDLRSNGGGSLREVISMVELFINGGPVVQVKARNAAPMALGEPTVEQFYNGPLVVMVNELTASASEIFAAAIQDYHRGVIIGSTSTYGKGSVQRPVNIGDNSANGTVKLTQQLFYRVSGNTTQLQGVKADIVLPDVYEYQKVREKDNEWALPWDTITTAKYHSDNSIALANLKNLAQQRIKADTVFSILSSNIAWLDKAQNQDLPVDLASYKALDTQRQKVSNQNNQLLKLPVDKQLKFAPLTSKDAENTRYQDWLKKVNSDIYIDQAEKVLADILDTFQSKN